MNDVSDYYDKHFIEEDQRLQYNAFELPLTVQFIERYLPKGSKILDIACGTGRYASELLQKGYYLALNDLSEKNIVLTQQRVQGHPNVISITQEDAARSKLLTENTWDGILALGPVYHINSKEKRIKLLQKCHNALQPGGYAYIAFMSKAGAMIFGIKHNPSGILDQKEVSNLWKEGSDDKFVEGTKWFTHAWFCHPEEIYPLINNSGLKLLHLAGIEGVFGERMELFHNLPDKLKKKWMNFCFEFCEDKAMVYQSKHLLCVAKKNA